MRIDPGGLYPNQRTSGSTADQSRRGDTQPARDGGGDSVSVSSRARVLSLGRKALSEAPEVRRGAVDSARRRLSGDGATYDGRSVARAMIDAISQQTERTAAAEGHPEPSAGESR